MNLVSVVDTGKNIERAIMSTLFSLEMYRYGGAKAYMVARANIGYHLAKVVYHGFYKEEDAIKDECFTVLELVVYEAGFVVYYGYLLPNIKLLVGPQLALAFTIVSLGYTAYSALNNAYNLYNESNKNDEGVRNRYNESITKLFDEKYKEKIAKIHENNQYIDGELARKISQERAEIKDAHQKNTSFIGKFGIALHNLWNYWKVGNHTYDDFIKKGKTPEEIAYSSFKTDGSDLGLANNGFGEKIKIWLRSQKSDNEMYPEFISDAFLSCFEKFGFDPCRMFFYPTFVKIPTANEIFDSLIAAKKETEAKQIANGKAGSKKIENEIDYNKSPDIISKVQKPADTTVSQMSDKSFKECTGFKSTCNIYEYLWVPCTPANDEVEAHLNTQSEVVNIVSQEIPSVIPEGGSVELSHKAPESSIDTAEFIVTVVSSSNF